MREIQATCFLGALITYIAYKELTNVDVVLYKNLSTIGAIAASTLTTVNVFTGDSYLYPATIAGFSFCASIGSSLSSPPDFVLIRDCAIACAIAVPMYLTVNAFCNNNHSNGVAIAEFSLCFLVGLVFWSIIDHNRLKYFEQRLSEVQKTDHQKEKNTGTKWVEFKRWAPISKVQIYEPRRIFPFCENVKEELLHSKDVDSVFGDHINDSQSKKIRRYPNPIYFTEVRAFTDGANLKYETVGLRKQDRTFSSFEKSERNRIKLRKDYELSQLPEKYSGPIGFSGSIEEMIESLKECFVVLEDDGTPTFSRSYHTFARYCDMPGMHSLKNRLVKIELVCRQNGLVWNIYDQKGPNIHSRKRDNEVFSIQGTALSKKCSDSTRAFFDKVKSSSISDQINIIKIFFSLDKCSSNKIRLRPAIVHERDGVWFSKCWPHARSGFNTDVSISAFMWTVTLIRYKGIKDNHAQIIIEGVNDGFIPEKSVKIGKYFMCIADLLGEYKILEDGNIKYLRAIRTKVKNEFKLKYKARSEIWKRPKEEIKPMLEKICEERDHPPEGFARYGRYSVLASISSAFEPKDVVQDSCITWAVNVLKIANIFLQRTPNDFLFTDTSFYTPFSPGQCEERVANAELL